MARTKMNIAVIGLSLSSSWGNGHATTYRALLSALAELGHSVTFYERDVPWYSANRDLVAPEYCELLFYSSVNELQTVYRKRLAAADVVIVGSYVPDGIEIGEWVLDAAGGLVAFYDIDTPVTLAQIRTDSCSYLSRDLISRYPLYLSFAGGQSLVQLERQYHSPRALPLYCSVDPQRYFPETSEAIEPGTPAAPGYALGYLGTYSLDRQPGLERFMLQVAAACNDLRFVVAGPQFPDTDRWPQNVAYREHCPPDEHRRFYLSQRYTLNLTRADMKAIGHSPSVRLFEAAACGVPILTDAWTGLEEFFDPNTELFVVHHTEDVTALLRETTEEQRQQVGIHARNRVLNEHTAAHRANTLEQYLYEARATSKAA